MTEGDFAALLGRWCRSEEDVTVETAIAHMQAALCALMPDQQQEDSDICGATVVAWRNSEILLKDSEGKLYRIALDDENDFKIDQDGYESYYLLVDEGSLAKVLSPEAVAEFQRLQLVVVEETTTKNRDAELAEYERLKAKYEGKDNG